MELHKNSKGLDVWYSQGEIDWKKVKAAGIDFIIPRDGWGTNCEKDGKILYTDPKFIQYVKEAQEAGVSVPGVFHMIYAVNEAEAKENAACAINNVRKAGLPKETVIWCDQEEDTVEKAAQRGYNLTLEMQRKITETFCDYILDHGYCTGIYCNKDYIERVYKKDIINKYDIWLSDLSGEPDYPCVYQQYDWNSKVSGISAAVDRDRYIGQYTAGTARPASGSSAEKKEETITMRKTDQFIAALLAAGDGRYHYYDGLPNGIGCSEYTRQALVKAGVIYEGETFHAGSGNVGVLADTGRFQRLPWNPATLQAGDILWSQGHHVATWDGKNGVYEAAPESTHGRCDNGKTGVGHWSNHTYRNCGTGTYEWTCIYRIIEQQGQETKTGKIKSKEYVKGALALQDRALAYRNSFPYNCGLLDASGVTWGDCWNINPKTMVWSIVLGEPIWENKVTGEAHVRHVYINGINKSGLPDCTGNTIIDNYCTETTFRQMIQAGKAPCLLLISGAHMGAYIGDFERDGKIYNVTEFSPNAKLNGKMRSYVDEYGRRMTCKGGEVISSWNRCGYLTAFIDYSDWDDPQPTPAPVPSPTPAPAPVPDMDPGDISDLTLALQIYRGDYGNNPARKAAVTLKHGAGKYEKAQGIVDKIVSAMNWYRIEITLAQEILQGVWGVNPARQSDITNKYSANAYRIAQGFVNDIVYKKYTIDDLKTSHTVADRILSNVYGNDPERSKTITDRYGEAVRSLAQGIVNEVLKTI